MSLFISCRLRFAWRQLVHLVVEAGVDLPEFLLDVHQVPQHAVVGMAQLFELVAGADVGPLIEIAVRNRIADVLEVQDRFDDHVPHDGVGGDHREEGGNDGHRDEDGVVLRDVPLRLGERKRDLGGAEDVGSGPGPDGKRLDAPVIGIVTLHAGLGGDDGAEVLVVATFAVLVDDVLLITEQPVEGVGLREVAVPLAGVGLLRIGGDELPVVLAKLAWLECLVELANDRNRFGILPGEFPVEILQVLGDEQFGSLAMLPPDDVQVQLRIEVEAAGDQQHQSAPEEEAAFALEAGFPQQALDRSIGHSGVVLASEGRARVTSAGPELSAS